MRLGNSVVVAAGMAFLALAASAQVAMVSGDVKSTGGKPVQNAVIRITRTDIKQNFEATSDEKGHYLYSGLPIGTYNLAVFVDGKQMDAVNGVRISPDAAKPVDFDLSKPRQAQIAADIEDRSARMKKLIELNNSFTAGMTALQARQYDRAVEAFTKASEIDPSQTAVWAELGEAYLKLAGDKTGPDYDANIQKALAAYSKTIELKPNDPATHNNYALALAKAKKFPETEAELKKAADLDPPNAGRYYFNLGAILFVAGRSEQALEAFKAAAEAGNPAGYCQYGIGLATKAVPKSNGEVTPVPGTVEALQKCLDLAADSRVVGQTWFLLASFGATLPIPKQVADIEDSGKYLKIPAPQAVRSARPSASGSVRRTIENGTPYPLTVVFSGPDSQQVALLPGASRTVTMPVGTYKVAARVTAPDVLPFFGVQQYDSNYDYQSRFYIERVP